MRRLVILVVTLPLLPQTPKPPARTPAPGIAWSYETPRDFQLPEPSYRFPTPIKQALVQFVQPVPALTREYQAVFLDKRKFSVWFKKVLTEARSTRTKAAKAEGTVLSSNLSKLSTDGGTVLSTTKLPPKREADPEAIERYLDVLKHWAPD